MKNINVLLPLRLRGIGNVIFPIKRNCKTVKRRPNLSCRREVFFVIAHRINSKTIGYGRAWRRALVNTPVYKTAFAHLRIDMPVRRIVIFDTGASADICNRPACPVCGVPISFGICSYPKTRNINWLNIIIYINLFGQNRLNAFHIGTESLSCS